MMLSRPEGGEDEAEADSPLICAACQGGRRSQEEERESGGEGGGEGR